MLYEACLLGKTYCKYHVPLCGMSSSGHTAGGTWNTRNLRSVPMCRLKRVERVAVASKLTKRGFGIYADEPYSGNNKFAVAHLSAAILGKYR